MMDVDALQAGAELLQAQRGVIAKHAPPQFFLYRGTIRDDFALLLDELPGQPFYHYCLLRPNTIPLADVAALVGSATLSTFPASSGADSPHSHLWSLPAEFTPPQPGDRVAVLLYVTPGNDFYNDPEREPWVLGVLMRVDVNPGSLG